MSYKITAEQQAVLDAALLENSATRAGTAKWEVVFTDGKHSTMLSEYCHTKHAAMLAAIERFGKKVRDIK
ncbi:hypothetical protein fHeYen801_127 [Yersinia phage fHe-Yen8-01]|nr:hypothetical protein fHeYen801_127 [Yersinia phage fHe-Yen8-01]